MLFRSNETLRHRPVIPNAEPRLTKQPARWRARHHSPDRLITTWVGQARRAAHAGDGGRREEALLFHPSGVAFDNRGNLYIADSNNHAIRKVGLDGTVTTNP